MEEQEKGPAAKGLEIVQRKWAKTKKGRHFCHRNVAKKGFMRQKSRQRQIANFQIVT
jgi:hypothetical protein